MKSLLANGDDVGPARTEAGTADAAGAEPEQGLHDLVAGVGRVGERVEPDLDPDLHAGDERHAA